MLVSGLSVSARTLEKMVGSMNPPTGISGNHVSVTRVMWRISHYGFNALSVSLCLSMIKMVILAIAHPATMRCFCKKLNIWEVVISRQ